MKLLVVDDDADLLAVVSFALRQAVRAREARPGLIERTADGRQGQGPAKGRDPFDHRRLLQQLVGRQRSEVFRLQPRVLRDSCKHLGSKFVSLMEGEDVARRSGAREDLM